MTEPAFYRLPEELLTLIADFLVDETRTFQLCRHVFPRLKALRLVHPNFARLTSIQKVLFNGIRLVADPAHLDIVEATELCRFAPFVRRVLFKPSMYSYTLTQKLFRRLAERDVAEDGWKEKCVAEGRPTVSKGAPSMFWRDIDDCGDHDFLCSDHDHLEDTEYLEREGDSTRHEYQQSRERALSAYQIIQSGRAQRVWAKALEALPQARAFRISKWIIHSYIKEDETTLLRKVVRQTLADEWDEEELRGRFAAPLGDQLFDLVMRTLEDASIKPLELDLRYDTRGDSLRDLLTGHQSDVFTELQTFFFRPWSYGFTPDGEFFTAEENDCLVADQAKDAFTIMLNRCTASLRYLNITPNCPFGFPALDAIDVLPPAPELRRLEIEYILLNTAPFATWLRQCSKLEYISMESINTTSDELASWRDVFDAIRYHPNRMQIEFDSIGTSGGITMSVSHHTAKPVNIDMSDEDGHPAHDSLCGYLSKSCEWNAALVEWFES